MLLVTGITGHSGRYFLHELIDHHYDGAIRCVVRESSDISLLGNSGLNLEIVYGDLKDQDFLDQAMVGIDTVLHIASIFYSIPVIKAAVANQVQKVILLHTTGIYSKYKSASQEYKNIEQVIKATIQENASGMDLIILRPTMIYGNICDKNMILFIKMVDRFRVLPIIEHGNNLLQPVNGEDLGKAYYQLLTNPSVQHGDYILSGDRPITMLEMLQSISRVLGKKTMFISVPLRLGIFLAMAAKIVSFGKIDYIEKVQRMGEDRSFPHDAAQRDFGYAPMPFEAGLAREIEQYLNTFRPEPKEYIKQ